MFHPCSLLFTKTQKRKNQTRVCPPIFQLPLITSPRYPYPQCPNRFYYVPFHLLGYPILPFGVSHFTFWGIPFHLLGYPILPFGVSHFTFWGIFFGTFAHNVQPRCPIWLLRFSQQKHVRFLSFRFIMFLRNSLGWIKYIL